MNAAPWVKISSKAILDPKLHASDRKVLFTLEMKAGSSRLARYSLKALQLLVGLDRVTVYRSLKHLQERGYLVGKQKELGKKVTEFQLAPVSKPFTKCWRCVWYSDLDFHEKDILLTIMASHRADGNKFVIFYGRNYRGLIDLCRLRIYAGHNWKKARELLLGALAKFRSMGVLRTIDRASKETAMAAEVNEDRLLELSKAMGDEWVTWDTKRLRLANQKAEECRRETDQTADEDGPVCCKGADGVCCKGADGACCKGADAEKFQEKRRPAVLSKPPSRRQEERKTEAATTLLEASQSLPEYRSSYAPEKELEIVKVFIENLDPGWLPQDLCVAWKNKDFDGKRLFCWQELLKKPDLAVRVAGAMKRAARERSRTPEELILDTDFLQNTHLLLDPHEPACGDREFRRARRWFVTALLNLEPGVPREEFKDGKVDVRYGRFTEDHKKAIRAEFRRLQGEGR